MADTTISQLQSIAATGNTVIPVSLGGITYQTPASSIIDTIGSRIDGLVIPRGTTAQRPASPLEGTIRFNTTSNNLECWTGSYWSGSPLDIDFILVAGGGGGGGCNNSAGGGGGGAGGMILGTISVVPGTYQVTVGNGGVGGNGQYSNGSKGSNSIFHTYEVEGGGYGAAEAAGSPYCAVGGNGGSGGGGNRCDAPTGAGGQGINGQGNNGGAGYSGTIESGGGGGKGAVGQTGSNNKGGNGGVGLASSIRTGSSIFYAGGGGAGAYYSGSTAGTGGQGGGGNGGGRSVVGSNATANTGGGGGGAGGFALQGGNGGSGIIVIRYIGSQRANGGTVTSYSLNNTLYTVHSYTVVGNFSFSFT